MQSEPQVKNAFGLYITFDGDKWTEWRNSAKLAEYYADVRIVVDGKIIDMTMEEFRDRIFARPEAERKDGWYPAPKYWRPTAHSYVMFSSRFIDGIYTTIDGERWVLDIPRMPEPLPSREPQNGER